MNNRNFEDILNKMVNDLFGSIPSDTEPVKETVSPKEPIVPRGQTCVTISYDPQDPFKCNIFSKNSSDPNLAAALLALFGHVVAKDTLLDEKDLTKKIMMAVSKVLVDEAKTLVSNFFDNLFKEGYK